MADLKITIGADLQGAIAQVNALGAGVTKLGASAGAVSPAVGKTLDALKNIKPGANQAGQALVDLGRIAQDAPFGFIGIQNNIGPLIDSFGRLKASTGSTGGALKALLGSLGGAGGIGLAVSAITAAVTFASIGFDRWIPKIKEAKKEVVDLDTIIRSGASIQAESAASVDSQIAKVQALARVVTDESKSYAVRNNALLGLKETNKGYFGDLDLEAVKTGLLTTKVQEYTKALVAQAVVKGFQDDLAKVSTERAKSLNQLRDQQKVFDALKKTADASNAAATNNRGNGSFGNLFDSNKLEDARDNLRETLTTYQALDKQFGFLQTSIVGAVNETLKFQTLDTGGKAKKDTDALKEQIKNLEAYQAAVGLTNVQFATLVGLREQLVRRDQKKLGLDDAQLAKEVVAIRNSNEQLEARAKALDGIAKSVGLLQGEKQEALNISVGIALNDQTTGKLDLNQTQRTLDDIARKAGLNLPLTIALDKDVQERIRKQVGELPLIGKPINVPPANLGIKEAIARINTQLAGTPITPPKIDLKPGLDLAKKDAEAFARNLSEIVSNAVVDSVSGLGEALGAAIAGGNIADVFKGIIETMAEGLQQIGKAAIAYGVGLIAIKKAFTNPTTAIAAGVALVAIGAALKTTLSQRKFAEGGIVTGPTNALIGEAGQPEVVFPLNKLNSFVKNMAGAGNQQSGFVAETRLAGSDIILSIRREQNRSGGTFSF